MAWLRKPVDVTLETCMQQKHEQGPGLIEPVADTGPIGYSKVPGYSDNLATMTVFVPKGSSYPENDQIEWQSITGLQQHFFGFPALSL